MNVSSVLEYKGVEIPRGGWGGNIHIWSLTRSIRQCCTKGLVSPLGTILQNKSTHVNECMPKGMIRLKLSIHIHILYDSLNYANL